MRDQVAQSVEHIPFKDGVPGSSPGLVTKKAAFRYSKPLFLLPYGFFRNFAPIHAAAVGLHAGVLKCKGYGAFHHYIAFLTLASHSGWFAGLPFCSKYKTLRI